MTLSQADWKNLQADLSSLKGSSFVGVLVGVGSMILHFSHGATHHAGTIVVQCLFETFDDGTLNAGDGVSSSTSVALFGFLNQHVLDVGVDVNGKLIFEFGSGRGLRIIPSGSGFESYVLNTSNGVFPVY